MLVRVIFIGTQFSNLYTAVDTPARGRVGEKTLGKTFPSQHEILHPRILGSSVERGLGKSKKL
jgi:hypothetical protein